MNITVLPGTESLSFQINDNSRLVDSIWMCIDWVLLYIQLQSLVAYAMLSSCFSRVICIRLSHLILDFYIGLNRKELLLDLLECHDDVWKRSLKQDCFEMLPEWMQWLSRCNFARQIVPCTRCSNRESLDEYLMFWLRTGDYDSSIVELLLSSVITHVT